MIYNPMKTLPQDASTEVKHAQVIYLEMVLGVTRDEIEKITGYARSTIRTLISKLKNEVERFKTFFEKVVKKVVEVASNKYYAYLIKIYGETDYTKVGYTNNIERRMKELSKKYGITEILKIYEFEDKENALTMENAMRKHFKKQGQIHIPQDRFIQFEPTETDYTELNNKYEFIMANL